MNRFCHVLALLCLLLMACPLPSTMAQGIVWTQEEKEFLHSAPEVFVFLNPADPPFSQYDNQKKQWQGIYPDLLAAIQKSSGLSFQYLSIKSAAEADQKLHEKKYVLIPGAYKAADSQDAKGNFYSTLLFYEKYVVLTERDNTLTEIENLRLALPASFRGQEDWIRKKHPHWQLLPVPTLSESLQRTLVHQSDLTLMSAIRLQNENTLLLYPSLSTVPHLGIEISVCLKLSTGSPLPLRQILNKSLAALGPQIDRICIEHSLVHRSEWTMPYLFLHYPFQIGGLLFLLFVFFLGTAFLFSHDRLLGRQKHQLEKKNQALSAAFYTLQKTLQERDLYKISAETDPLTGLLNKQIFATKFQQQIALSQTAVLLILDLDHFKEANDQLGHPYGDALLKKLAQALKESGPADTLYGRFGGDEFLIGLPVSLSHQQVIDLARKFCRMARTLDENSTVSPPLSASIGIAFYPQHGTTYFELFQSADQALYQVKKAGRDHWQIAP